MTYEVYDTTSFGRVRCPKLGKDLATRRAEMKMRDWMKTAVYRAKEVDWTKAASRKPRHKNMSAMQDLQVLMRYCNTRQEVNV